jgi:UDP-glucose:glycoprotein glucosyltransferase
MMDRTFVKPSSGALKVFAVVDMASHLGQKILGITQLLSELTSTHIEVYLSPQLNMKKSVERFYHLVCSTKLSFDSDGHIVSPSAPFTKLPEEPLLTMALDVPNGWIVMPFKSSYDLDNLRPSESRQPIESTFQLKHILIEGHVTDANTRPRGLQFVLKAPNQSIVDDTITMANLGYFQLKASPGVWSVAIRNGRSADIYQWQTLNYQPVEHDLEVRVIVDSFHGLTLIPTVCSHCIHYQVSKRKGMESEDVLKPASSNLWNSFQS